MEDSKTKQEGENLESYTTEKKRRFFVISVALISAGNFLKQGRNFKPTFVLKLFRGFKHYVRTCKMWLC